MYIIIKIQSVINIGIDGIINEPVVLNGSFEINADRAVIINVVRAESIVSAVSDIDTAVLIGPIDLVADHDIAPGIVVEVNSRDNILINIILFYPEIISLTHIDTVILVTAPDDICQDPVVISAIGIDINTQ